MLRKCVAKDEIARVALERLGFESLRPGQREGIEALLAGRDVLVVQPTGSGKSAIYQIAGLLIDGATVVVSPLIALQKDQVDSISEQNSAEALALNSSKRAVEMRDAWEKVGKGRIEYIFLAPEQLRKPETLKRLGEAQVSLFVVDEAHCISQWGHDFRPDYLSLGAIVESLGHPQVLALTATASPNVRSEIVSRLGMRRPKISVTGFDRPNIYLRVDRFKTKDEKRQALLHRVIWAEKPGIVYTATRKAAEEIVEQLSEHGVNSLFYHAGLRGKERESIHERYMSGAADVIVATNAFGMGVDKPDIRFVYHCDAPESLDSYYQEIGRAGRDGKPSEAVLFYRHEDIGSQKFKTGEGAIDRKTLEAVGTRVADAADGIDAKSLALELGLSQRKLATATHRLEHGGAVQALPDGRIAAVKAVDLQDAVQRAIEWQEQTREAKRQRLRDMQDYAESAGCRREILLRYLGDSFSGPCGFCDNCERAGEQRQAAVAGERREVA
jgi:ATP-dependent DNA helicase RecQ